MDNFWATTSLQDMTDDQWESLCDGCGLCCLHKYESNGTVSYLDRVCDNFDCNNGGCSDYTNRHESMPHCIKLTPKNVAEFYWLPETCAYRRVHKHEKLPDWHYLITGTRQSVIDAGINVVGHVHKNDDSAQVIKWIEQSF